MDKSFLLQFLLQQKQPNREKSKKNAAKLFTVLKIECKVYPDPTFKCLTSLYYGEPKCEILQDVTRIDS
jgi:hypothetical protein